VSTVSGTGNPLKGGEVSTEEKLRARELSEFERLVADLCASFAKAGAAEIESTLDACLRRLGEFLRAERAFLGRFEENGGSLTIDNVWAAPGISPGGRAFEIDISAEIPWVSRQMREGRVINTGPGLAELPEEARDLRQLLEADGISSGVVVPVSIEGKGVGMLGLDTTHRPRDYPQPLIDRLRLVADVIGSTLRRVSAELALKKSLEEVEQLKERLESENVYLRQEIELEHGPHRIVGESAALLRVLEDARQVAGTTSTVLIGGETGTGKELLARFIHETSDRSDRPMVKVNCGALPATLVESELFGRERGAYTGAMARQTGRFEVADGSTLFLDEVGELSIETQVKLLRVLEEGEFERLGSSKTIRVDVRVIAATNRDLASDVKVGRFRSDLFYRLNVFPLMLPPLRQRRGDIPLLTWAFVQEFSTQMGKPIESIKRETMRAFEAYSWPGNVRELRNVLERAMIRCRSRVLEAEVPRETLQPSEVGPDTSLDEAQRRHILDIMERTGWRVRGEGGAAELLDMKPSTLENRMKKLGLRRPR
jgi:transcriptional regulator with GAF, ATPase, and Fis domain